MKEFNGQLSIQLEQENTYNHGNLTKSIGKVGWIIKDDTKINHNAWPIENGDHLEVYDNRGELVLSKHIVKDYDSFYNVGLKKQIFNGTTVEWLPYGIDAGFWFSVFNNRYRARLVKHDED